jgi:hypothetical protein
VIVGYYEPRRPELPLFFSIVHLSHLFHTGRHDTASILSRLVLRLAGYTFTNTAMGA